MVGDFTVIITSFVSVLVNHLLISSLFRNVTKISPTKKIRPSTANTFFPFCINLNFDNLAPIVLFVYNRPDHTKQTIEALQKNELAKKSELFIYSDAAKNENAEKKVNEVREYIKSIDGFKKITIIEF